MEPYRGDAAGAHILTAVVDESGPDDVIVVDNAGRTDVSTWGGILSLGAASRGVRGVIVDGACRDIGESRDLGLAIYARGSTPVTARGRIQQHSSGEPIVIGGRTVCEGDVVLADSTGFAVVPRNQLDEVLTEAENIVARERAIADEVRAGHALRQSMRDARLAGDEQR